MSKVPMSFLILSFSFLGCVLVETDQSLSENVNFDSNSDAGYQTDAAKQDSNVHPKQTSEPGPCDPSYVYIYVDKYGNEHTLEIPTICGPEEIYKGDPPPPGVGITAVQDHI